VSSIAFVEAAVIVLHSCLKGLDVLAARTGLLFPSSDADQIV
jgi:hypothetical protein